MISTDAAAKLMDKVIVGIEDNIQDEREELEMDATNEDAREQAEMLEADADDYRAIADLLRCGQADDAHEKYDGMDTASRDYLYDGDISDDEAAQVMAVMEDGDDD
jgi:hypothetical protein